MIDSLPAITLPKWLANAGAENQPSLPLHKTLCDSLNNSSSGLKCGSTKFAARISPMPVVST
jgi:hypothetical protein